MPQLNRRQFNLGLLAGGASLAAPAAFANSGFWPAKPARVIVPYPPGGFTDVTARLVAQKLQEHFGQPFTIDNKAGANGIIGVDALAKSPGDGYHFGVVIAAYAANTSLYAKLPYDPRRDLSAVSLIGISPLVAAVRNDAPYKSIGELLAYARRNPGKISFGSSGIGSAVHLSTELLKSQTGTYMVHIPYRGAAAALTDLMGGQIDFFMDAASGLIGPGQQGKVRLIGVASDKRLPVLPDVPTFIEQGIPGFTANTWAGMLAPSGTPKEIVRRVSEQVARIVQQDDVKARLEAMGTVPIGNTPEAFERFLAEETEKWGKVIRTAKVSLD